MMTREVKPFLHLPTYPFQVTSLQTIVLIVIKIRERSRHNEQGNTILQYLSSTELLPAPTLESVCKQRGNQET